MRTISASNTLWCNKCKADKDLAAFSKSASTRTGYAVWCKDCMRQYQQKYRRTHVAKQLSYSEMTERYGRDKVLAVKKKHYTSHTESWRDYARRRKYGIEPEQFERMMQDQKGLCAICSDPFSEDLRPCVDHCHTTSRVRGILCDACNTGLGQFRDSIERLVAAVDFLHKDTEKTSDAPSESHRQVGRLDNPAEALAR